LKGDAAMNATDMINILSLRLEDAANITFTDAAKIKALNNAQVYAAQRLRDEYLTELQVIETGLTAAGGELSLGSL